MINSNTPIHVVIDLSEMYEIMSDIIVENSEYDMPLSIKSFADFAEDIVSAILPCSVSNGMASAVEKAILYVGNIDAYPLVNRIFTDLSIQVRHLRLPVYPVGGFNYRFYITGNLNLNIHYENTSPRENIKLTHTRDDILNCINNGDYISEKLRREYGL